jgi:hypothetical protein
MSLKIALPQCTIKLQSHLKAKPKSLESKTHLSTIINKYEIIDKALTIFNYDKTPGVDSPACIKKGYLIYKLTRTKAIIF